MTVTNLACDIRKLESVLLSDTSYVLSLAVGTPRAWSVDVLEADEMPDLLAGRDDNRELLEFRFLRGRQ